MNGKWILALSMVVATAGWSAEPVSYSGIYPHLAMFNNEGECGTGAVVPFADRLWVITYGPHLPYGSSDKLYEIAPDLTRVVRPESIGGTPANRLIHRETNQLLIGPYVIDAQRRVRVIPFTAMPGRLTATARHLTDPAHKVYYATMEEGLYEVDVNTLAVKPLYADTNKPPASITALVGLPFSDLPGYHGKGGYSGQGRVIYANNGEQSADALKKPFIPSGCLAEWKDGAWKVVRRNQFTEVTGPGGIEGNPRPDTDPIWSVGWDHRSLMLMVLDGGKWTCYRLPKSSHSYDGAHGWNTEWPRIRAIGERDLLMTMHGCFWRFPRDFSASHAAGIRPRSNYLKVIGDFARWQDRLVFGCDDTAKSEFLNVRAAKGKIAGPGQSQSNLWFVDPDDLDRLGPVLGRGGVWVDEPVSANTASDPFLFAGYRYRGLHLAQKGTQPLVVTVEVDAAGTGQWRALRDVNVPAGAATWVEFDRADGGEWVRLRPHSDAAGVTAWFAYRGVDARPIEADPMFRGLAPIAAKDALGGMVRTRGDNLRTLALTTDTGYYELDANLKLKKVDDAAAADYSRQNTVIPQGILSVDAASVIYTDDAGARWRLPRGAAEFDAVTGKGVLRISREVATERDLFNAHGTFYELPAENAGGFAKVRPIATHNRRITDYCSYRGMVVLTGIVPGARGEHIVRSADGQAAVWLGVADDLWKLGKPVGHGGPWQGTAVKAGQVSDPYLMTGYDRKRLTLSHDRNQPLTVKVEVDATGDGHWMTYREFTMTNREPLVHQFPAGFNATWLRVSADHDATVTAQLVYE
ncbi:MAG: hypothetical protein HZB16_18085 [Armatimonadetes bacterium]|nr:hypothetical protein [Armatimonadota bacterium]